MMLNSQEVVALQARLAAIGFFRQHELTWLEETGSTSDDLKLDWKSDRPVPRIEVAEFQTAGRGQYQRRWSNRPGQCLMFSFSAEVPIDAFPPSLMAGIALCLALQNCCGSLPLELWLKWPNDIFIGQRKLAGILTESICQSDLLRVVVGVGINMLPLDEPMVLSAGTFEFAEQLKPAELLLGFCETWNDLQKYDAHQLCLLWSNYAGLFWSTDFDCSIGGDEEFQARPLRLMTGGTLLVQNEKGLQREIVSATLKPRFNG